MSITVIGHEEKITQWNGSNSHTVNVPSNTQEGDIMFAFSGCDNDAYATINGDWTEIEKTNNNIIYIRCWYKVATSNEPSSYTFSSVHEANRYELSHIATIRGGDTDFVSTSGTSLGNIAKTSSITTISDDNLVIGYVFILDSSGSLWADSPFPDGYNVLWEANEDAGDTSGDIAAYFTQNTAGSTGDISFNRAGASSCAGFTIGVPLGSAISVPSSISFPKQHDGAGESATKDIIVQNTGNAALTISSITVPTGFTVVSYPSSISSGYSGTIVVRRDIEQIGNLSGSMRINSNAPSSPTFVSLSGEVAESDNGGIPINFEVNLFPPFGSNYVIDLYEFDDTSVRNSLRTTQIPYKAGVLKHGDTFTLYGSKAQYVKDNFTSGVVGDATSFPIKVIS